MEVDLREINMQNFEQCIKLHTKKSQRDFVESVVYCLAEAKADNISIPLAIYNGLGEMVGFIMYSVDHALKTACISHVLIDYHHQGKGYGKKAISQVINRIRQIPGINEIWMSYHPQNTVAEHLYNQLGFITTDEIWYGEKVCRMKLTLPDENYSLNTEFTKT